MAAYTQESPIMENIFVSPADLILDPGVSEVFLGATQGETQIVAQNEYKDIEVEQAIGPVGHLLVNQSCEVTGTLAEATVANLKRLLGSGSGSGFGSNSAPSAQVFEIRGKGIGTTTRTVKIFKGVIETGTTIKYSKSEESVIPFTIKCYKDLTQSEGEQFFSITEA